MPDSDHPSTSNVVKHLRTGTSGIRGANDRARSRNCDQVEREASMVLGKRKLPLGSFSSEQGPPPTRKLPGGNKVKGFAVGEKEQEAMNHKYQVEVHPSLETTITESSNIRSRLVWVKVQFVLVCLSQKIEYLYRMSLYVHSYCWFVYIFLFSPPSSLFQVPSLFARQVFLFPEIRCQAWYADLCAESPPALGVLGILAWMIFDSV
jgi:hypothetical protein